MTPFGQRLRELREEHQIKQADMAESLGLSAAYISALEHGHRGKPSRELVHQICAFFGLIWEDADHLQQLAATSHPKISVNTAGMNPLATECANLLASDIAGKSDKQLEELRDFLIAQRQDKA